jgi:hypothetical protein
LNINTSSVLVSLMQLFFAVGSLCLSFVLGFRKLKKIRNAKTILLKEKCQTLIVGLLFDENLSPESAEMEIFFLKNTHRRQLFLEELMCLHKSLQGDMATTIERYYILKNFDKLSLKKLKSEKDHKVLQGIDELVEMKNSNSIQIFDNLLQQTIDISLKNYLMIAIIKLDPEIGLQKLFSFDNYLTDWLQLRIIKILDEMKFLSPPSLSEWIEKGDSFAIFGCRLTAYTKAEKDIPILKMLLSSKNIPLRIEAIRTLGIVDAQEVNDLLIKSYFREYITVKVAILDTLAMFKNPNNFPFFISCSKSDTHDTQLLALKGINLLLEDGTFSTDKFKIQNLYFNQLNKISATK